MTNAYALIMAGGAGTRLWPLSREDRPKPLIKLVDRERSMFQIAVERLDPLFPPERVLVVANATLTPQLQAQAPAIPPENFIVEPSGRNTAPAIGLAAVHALHRDPDAVLAVLTADHYIQDEARFREVLGAAVEVAAGGGIVTLGIEPDHPATGFGYIERGALAQTVNGVDVYTLAQFREKPDEATAERYVASGRYSWNSGMFIWQAARVMAEFEQHTPEIYTSLMQIASAVGEARYNEVLREVWPDIRKISIDYAVMEHVEAGVFVIPVEMGWSDIGSFDALYDILSGGDESVAQPGSTILVDTDRALIMSDKLVATIGLEDVVIIETDDALLVCRRDRAQDVKQIVERLKKENRNRYL